MKFSKIMVGVLFITLLIPLHSAFAAWKYDGCSDISGSDFETVPILTKSQHSAMHEPLKMGFYQDDDGNTNIFVILRAGKIKYYDAATKEVTDVGSLSPSTANEDGLIGIAIDPDFKDGSGWIYLNYAIDDVFRVSRFDVNNLRMDKGSEKVILDMPSYRDRWHTAGAMGFDDYGDLWIHVGDNETAETGPANVGDFRGKILRIRPLDDGTYEIPEGNLWEFAAEKFEAEGQSDVAEEYRDPNKAKREIFAMGMRNPYTMGLDPVRRWSSYGDCGPDFGGVSEEHTLVPEPGFYGWPYWTAATYKQPGYPDGYDTPGTMWGTKDPQNPINSHNEATISQLLPHSPAQHYYARSCAMTGPIARYFPDSKASYKVPPHLDHIWFIADFNSSWVDAIQISDDGKEKQKQERMWDRGDWGKMLDFQQGPDGALYMLGYTCNQWRASDGCTGVWRIEYKGPSCEDPDFKMEKVGCMEENNSEFDPDATHNDPRLCGTPLIGAVVNGVKGGFAINGLEITIEDQGPHSIQVFDVAGKSVAKEIMGTGEARYPMPKLKQQGLFFIQVKTPQGIFTKRFMNY